METANEVVDVARRPGPVDAPDFARQLRGEGRERMVLRGVGGASCGNVPHGRHQQIGAKHGERPLDGSAGLAGPDRTHGARQYRPGVHLAHQSHHRDARLALARNHGAMNRGRPTVFRQKRGVHVDRSERRGMEDLVGQQFAVRGDHAKIRPGRGQLGRELRIPGAFGLQHRNPVRRGRRLDRRRQQPLAPAPAPVWLRHRHDDLCTGRHETLE